VFQSFNCNSRKGNGLSYPQESQPNLLVGLDNRYEIKTQVQTKFISEFGNAAMDTSFQKFLIGRFDKFEKGIGGWACK